MNLIDRKFNGSCQGLERGSDGMIGMEFQLCKVRTRLWMVGMLAIQVNVLTTTEEHLKVVQFYDKFYAMCMLQP